MHTHHAFLFSSPSSLHPLYVTRPTIMLTPPFPFTLSSCLIFGLQPDGCIRAIPSHPSIHPSILVSFSFSPFSFPLDQSDAIIQPPHDGSHPSLSWHMESVRLVRDDTMLDPTFDSTSERPHLKRMVSLIHFFSCSFRQTIPRLSQPTHPLQSHTSPPPHRPHTTIRPTPPI